MEIVKRYFLSLGFLMLLFSVFISFSPQVASAQTMWGMQKGKSQIADVFGQNAEQPRDIRVFVIRLIKIALTFIGVIMIAIMIFAGAKWMTAGGNQDQIEGAKNHIKNAAIGMAIILASYMIVDFVGRCVMQALEGSGIWGC